MVYIEVMQLHTFWHFAYLLMLIHNASKTSYICKSIIYTISMLLGCFITYANSMYVAGWELGQKGTCHIQGTWPDTEVARRPTDHACHVTRVTVVVGKRKNKFITDQIWCQIQCEASGKLKKNTTFLDCMYIWKQARILRSPTFPQDTLTMDIVADIRGLLHAVVGFRST